MHSKDMALQVIETDLGEYIVQLRGEPPSHIITPAVHLEAPGCREVVPGEAGSTIYRRYQRHDQCSSPNIASGIP